MRLQACCSCLGLAIYTTTRIACRIMLCAAIKDVRHLLAGGRLCERVHFVAQASPARPLAAHLQQFAGWAQARAPHLRCLTISHSHTTVGEPDYDPGNELTWLCRCLAPDAMPALLGLLHALHGAGQLAELRLEIEALPAGFDRENPTTTNLPASSELLELPRLEMLHLAFPAQRLVGSLAHLSRLHTLSLEGVLLDPAIRLPPTLTALQGHGAYYTAVESIAAICEIPRFGAPGLRSLAIRGGSYYCGTRPLLLRGLSQLTGLTSLAIDGPRLGREKEEEEEGEQAAQQAAGALAEVEQLQALQRLSLLHAIGFAVEGQPLVLPHWPALKVRLP